MALLPDVALVSRNGKNTLGVTVGLGDGYGSTSLGERETLTLEFDEQQRNSFFILTYQGKYLTCNPTSIDTMFPPTSRKTVNSRFFREVQPDGLWAIKHWSTQKYVVIRDQYLVLASSISRRGDLWGLVYATHPTVNLRVRNKYARLVGNAILVDLPRPSGMECVFNVINEGGFLVIKGCNNMRLKGDGKMVLDNPPETYYTLQVMVQQGQAFVFFMCFNGKYLVMSDGRLHAASIPQEEIKLERSEAEIAFVTKHGKLLTCRNGSLSFNFNHFSLLPTPPPPLPHPPTHPHFPLSQEVWFLLWGGHISAHFQCGEVGE